MIENIKPITEAPQMVLRHLYDLRLKPAHENIPFQEYVSRFHFITIDGEPYVSENVDKQVVEKWCNTTGGFALLCLPDVVVQRYKVIKNRYGNSD